jgi:hypothetical protein
LGGFDAHGDPPNGHVPTNPLERFNREIAPRTDVVGIFPDDASLIRLASMLAIEQDDERLVGRRYLSAHSMDSLLSAGLDHTPKTKRRSSSSPRPKQPRSPTRRALRSYTTSRDLTVGRAHLDVAPATPARAAAVVVRDDVAA